MIVLAVDPDTTTIGWALTRDRVPVRAGLVEVPARTKVAQRKLDVMRAFERELSRLRTSDIPEFTSVDRIVVEGQRHRVGSKVRPQDLINLAQVAGFCAGVLQSLYPSAELVIPEPADWKGTVKKEAFTKRILADYDLVVTAEGLCYSKSTCRVPGTQGLRKAKATHVIDALGMARWGWRTGGGALRDRPAPARGR